MPIKNLVVVSDIHAGSKVGLCPPRGVPLLDGGTYKPSRIQRKMWKHWRTFWDEWVPGKTKGEPFSLVLNGDLMDWDHHGTSSIFSKSVGDQLACARAILEPIAEKAERVFLTIGTIAHSGEQGEAEEALGAALGAEQDPEEGRFAAYELWIYVGRALCHICHTVGTTQSDYYETTAVHKELIAAFKEAGAHRERPPDMVIRSHRHQYCKTTILGRDDDAESIVTPGWQAKTPWYYRTAKGRSGSAQMGGVLIREGSDGDVYELHKGWRLGRPRVRR